MNLSSPRITLIGGTYRALCVLERLLERGEHVVAFIGQEGGGERDFCPEILELCDRHSIPARSAHKLGEEIVRWLEDRVRPDLAIAVGVSMEIPFAIGGNTRLGLLEVSDFFPNESGTGVALRQRGQEVLARKLPAPADDDEAGDAYLRMVDEMIDLIDEFLDGLPPATRTQRVRVPFESCALADDALEQIGHHPEPGADTNELEREAARYLGAERVLAVRSTTEAFVLLATALQLDECEVICSAIASEAAIAALGSHGATPVFADVEPGTLAPDPDRVGDVLSPATRALLISHPFGQPAALHRLYALAKEAGLEVVEDAGASLGARFGPSRLGRGPCTAVFRLPLGGDSGCEAVLIALPSALACAVEPVAGALRLGDGAARIARGELARWEDVLAARRRNALVYAAELGRYDAFRIPQTPEDRLPTYAGFVLRVTRFARTSADDLHKLLLDCGVETRRIVLPVAGRQLGDVPVADQARASGILLPVHPGLTPAQLDHVLDCLFSYAIG